MNHLKVFNEELRPFEMARLIKDFCETHLAYLLDKSYFNIEVYPSTFEGGNIEYEIELRDNPEGTTFGGDRVFLWSDVKDQFIPFLTFLEKEYRILDIITFEYIPKIAQKRYSVRRLKSLDDLVKMKSIKIVVSPRGVPFIKRIKSFFGKNELNEGIWWDKKPIKKELKETVDSYLAYLIDDGFETGINLDLPDDDDKTTNLHIFKPYTGDVDATAEWGWGDHPFNDPNDIFYWNDIKDQFIPFLIAFSKEYSFELIRFYSYYGSDSRTFRRSSDSIKDLLNDKFIMDEELGEIIILNIRRL